MQHLCKIFALLCACMAGYVLMTPDETNRFICRSSVDWASDDMGPYFLYRDASRALVRDLRTNWGNYRGQHFHSAELGGKEPETVMRDFIARYQVKNRPWYDALELVSTPYYSTPGYIRLVLRYCKSVFWAAMAFCLLLLGRGALSSEIQQYFILRIAGSAMAWPIFIFVFPSRELAYTVQRGLAWAHWALSLLLSLVPASLAKAQNSGDKTEGGEEKISEQQTSAKNNYQVHLFADGLERQSWLIVNAKYWTAFQQNRQSSDGGSPFSFLGVGPKWGNRSVTVKSWTGPQAAWRTKKVTHIATFGVVNVTLPRFTFLSANKWVLPVAEGASFASRHVQNIHAPPMPSWLSLETEEFQVSGAKKRWQEMELGIQANLGGMTKTKSRFLSDCYIFFFRDVARGEWDLRFGYAHTF